MKRRLFLGDLLAGTAAPAIVRASGLMPIWVPKPAPWAQTIVGMQLLVDGQRLRDAQFCALLDQARLAQNPPWIGVDYGRPGGDMTVWTQMRMDVDGRLQLTNINVEDTWR